VVRQEQVTGYRGDVTVAENNVGLCDPPLLRLTQLWSSIRMAEDYAPVFVHKCRIA
jgi:hypothetical protein